MTRPLKVAVHDGFYRHGEPFDQAAAEVVAEAERIAKEARA